MEFTTEQLTPFLKIKHFKHYIKMLQKWVKDGFPDGEIGKSGQTERNPYGFEKLYGITLNFESYKLVQVGHCLSGLYVYTGPLNKQIEETFNGNFNALTKPPPSNDIANNYKRVWESQYLLDFVKALAEFE